MELDAIQIAVGNGRYHGGGIVVHEAAAIDGRLLHLYALAPQSVGALLAKLPWLLRSRPGITSGVETLTGTAFDVTTSERLSVNTDGEVTTYTPVKFSVSPEAVEVYAPA
jgi:diacylglycerol kinase family enzyme